MGRFIIDDSSAESKKGINAVQRCSVENQKGAIAVQSVAIVPFWFWTEHLWTALMPFLPSADELWRKSWVLCCTICIFREVCVHVILMKATCVSFYTRFLHKMNPGYQIIFPGDAAAGKPVIHKGQVQPIMLKVERKGGNKWVRFY